MYGDFVLVQSMLPMTDSCVSSLYCSYTEDALILRRYMLNKYLNINSQMVQRKREANLTKC